MSTAAARSARELQMMEGLVDCAYELATTFCAAAKAEADTRRSLDLLEGFHKCAFAVRMGIRLCMTLRAPPKAPAFAAERPEAFEAERPEAEPAEGPERDARERERDYEAVSLPRFLRTLGVVARDVERRGDGLPAKAAQVLPTLTGLLAEAGAAPREPPRREPQPSSGGVAVLIRPPATRHELLGSTATSLPGLPPRPPPPRSGSG
jgi:hypothetical protein